MEPITTIVTCIVGAIVTIYVARLDAKTKQIHREVTVNSHTSPKPTLKDDISELKSILLSHIAWHDSQEVDSRRSEAPQSDEQG
jgi:hypothetical protein